MNFIETDEGELLVLIKQVDNLIHRIASNRVIQGKKASLDPLFWERTFEKLIKFVGTKEAKALLKEMKE